MSWFGRKKKLPPMHPGDKQLLKQLRRMGYDPNKARHWLQYLYFASREDAQAAFEMLSAEGWQLAGEILQMPGELWAVCAERRDRPVNDETVIAARKFFESVAARFAGGDYDGWEAAVDGGGQQAEGQPQ